MIARNWNCPAESAPCVHPFLMDSIYLGGLFVSLPYLFAVGKGHVVLDHFRRRSQKILPRKGDRPCLWVHGVSVGEILSANHFLERFAHEFDDWEIVLSTTTRSGIDAGRQHYPDHPVISYPFDLSYLVKRAFDGVRPDLVIIVEHELWPNFLYHAYARRVPVAIVNGRLSERSFRGYRLLSRLVSWPPPGIVNLCVEDEGSARGFRELGVPPERIQVTGNFKFDASTQVLQGIREHLGFDSTKWVLVGASTHRGEEEVLLDVFNSLYSEDKNVRLILAPRRVDRVREVSRMVSKRGYRVDRWSSKRLALFGNGNGNGHLEASASGEVLIVDTVGELASLLSVGDVVFVGGSLVPFGGHNVIEPAILGRPVLTGPYHKNFWSVVSAFQERDALIVTKDGRHLLETLRVLKRDPLLAQGLAQRATETVRAHAGASERTLEALRPLIESVRVKSTVQQ